MRGYEKTINEVRRKIKEVFAEIYRQFEETEEVREYRPKNKGWTINDIFHIFLVNTLY